MDVKIKNYFQFYIFTHNLIEFNSNKNFKITVKTLKDKDFSISFDAKFIRYDNIYNALDSQ